MSEHAALDRAHSNAQRLLLRATNVSTPSTRRRNGNGGLSDLQQPMTADELVLSGSLQTPERRASRIVASASPRARLTMRRAIRDWSRSWYLDCVSDAIGRWERFVWQGRESPKWRGKARRFRLAAAQPALSQGISGGNLEGKIDTIRLREESARASGRIGTGSGRLTTLEKQLEHLELDVDVELDAADAALDDLAVLSHGLLSLMPETKSSTELNYFFNDTASTMSKDAGRASASGSMSAVSPFLGGSVRTPDKPDTKEGGMGLLDSEDHANVARESAQRSQFLRDNAAEAIALAQAEARNERARLLSDLAAEHQRNLESKVRAVQEESTAALQATKALYEQKIRTMLDHQGKNVVQGLQQQRVELEAQHAMEIQQLRAQLKHPRQLRP